MHILERSLINLSPSGKFSLGSMGERLSMIRGWWYWLCVLSIVWSPKPHRAAVSLQSGLAIYENHTRLPRSSSVT